MHVSDGVVKIGFVGSGSALWGYLAALDRILSTGHAKLGPICVRSAERRSAILRQRPSAILVATPAEVFASDADIVVVLTPPATHAEVAAEALRAGKHVLVEKPFAQSRSEGEALAELATSRGLRLYASPFTLLSPTVRLMWTIARRDVGGIHSTRALYGNSGSTWADWYHTSGAGPFSDMAIYNLKTITAVCGPVREVTALESTAVGVREINGELVASDPDVSHVILRHQSGALSSVVSSQAIQRYRRVAIELYGTEGTINLLGDDWAPRGLEVWRNATSSWAVHDALDETWTWADGLRELVDAIRSGTPPRGGIDHDLHLLDVIEAVRDACAAHASAWVASTFADPDLGLDAPTGLHHVHDRTLSPDHQL